MFDEFSKAVKPPKGYQPVPGSRARGYRKRQGNKWVYWYPHLGHTEAGEAHALGDSPKGHGVASTALADARRILASPSEVAKRVWKGIQHTAKEFPEALEAVNLLAEFQPLTRKHAKALISVTTMIGTAALVAPLGGPAAAAAAVGAKFATHVALTALHDYLDNTYTGVAGADFLDTLLTVAGVFKAQGAGPSKEEAFIEGLVASMKKVVDEMSPEEARRFQ